MAYSPTETITPSYVSPIGFLAGIRGALINAVDLRRHYRVKHGHHGGVHDTAAH